MPGEQVKRRRRGERGQAAAGVLVGTAALTLAAATAFRGDFAGLAPVKETVCRYNQTLFAQGYEVFSLTRGRPPRSQRELLDEGFRRPPRCPAGGEYALGPEGEVSCTFHDRQGPRLEVLGVFRTLPDPAHPVPVVAFRRPADRQVVFYARWPKSRVRRSVEIRWTGPDGRTIQAVRDPRNAKGEVSSELALFNTGQARPLAPGEYQVALRLDGKPAGNCSFWLLE